MRKSEIKTGMHYCLGSSSRFDVFRGVEAIVLEVNGSLDVRGVKHTGILIELRGDARHAYGLGLRGGRNPGEKAILDSARSIREPWTVFAERKRAHEEKLATREADADRRRTAIGEADDLIAACGIGRLRRDPQGYYTVAGDEMLTLLRAHSNT